MSQTNEIASGNHEAPNLEGVKRFHLLRYYLGVSLVLITVLTVVVAFLLTNTAERVFADRSAAGGAQDVGHIALLFYDAIWVPAIQENPDVKLSDVLQSESLSAFVRRATFGFDIVSLNVADPAGNVLWSFEPYGPGTQGYSPEAFAKVVERGTYSSELIQDDVTVMGSENPLDIVRVHYPLRDTSLAAPEEGMVIGVLQVDKNVTTELAANRQQTLFFTVGTSFGVGVGLFLLLLILVLRGDKAIARVHSEMLSQNQRLGESQELYRAVVENANDGIVIHTGSRKEFVNDAYLTIHGFDNREEALAASLGNIAIPEDRDFVVGTALARQRGEVVPDVYEYRVRRTDGEVRTLQAAGVRIAYQGAPASLALLRDVTDFKRAEEALRQSERRFRTIFEFAPDGIAIADADGRMISANRTFHDMLGFDYETREIEGLTYREITHPDDFQKNAELFESMVAGTIDHYVMEKRYLRKDAGIVWVRLSVSRLPDVEDGFRAAAMVEDITERRRAEEARERSEAHMHALVVAIPDMMFRIRWDGMFLDFMPGENASPLVPPTVFIGKNIYDVMPSEVAEDLMRLIAKALESGESQRHEYQLTVDGQTRDYESRIVVTAEDEVLAVVRDITESRQNDKKLRETSRLASVGELAAGVAHEINNPLTGVIGFSELIMNMKGIPDEARTDLERIHSEAQRAAKIVQNLLSFARRHEPEMKMVNLQRVVQNVLELKAHEFRVNNVEVTHEWSADFPKIMADEHQLAQVILNIVTNGEQAMSDTHDGGYIRIRGTANEEMVTIEIEDDGPGIPSNNLKNIFDPFFTTKEVGRGTGLGLSICYGLINQHGGVLSVDSTEGEGTTFTIKLPIGQPEPVEALEDLWVEKVQPERKHVLVVDDEDHIRDIVGRILEIEGHSVESAASAEEALTKVQNGAQFDHIFLDMRMPGMDGREFHKHLAQSYNGLASKVIFITGDTMSPDTHNFIAETGNLYINKPFASDEIVRVVNSAEPVVAQAGVVG
jgi:PAS domain S-box-containing protein